MPRCKWVTSYLILITVTVHICYYPQSMVRRENFVLVRKQLGGGIRTLLGPLTHSGRVTMCKAFLAAALVGVCGTGSTMYIS